MRLLAPVWLAVLTWQAVIRWTAEAPIGPPDFGNCHLAVDEAVVGPPEELKLNCCMTAVPPTVHVQEFSFADYGLNGHSHHQHHHRRRRRVAAHKTTAARIAQYNRAYSLMKALPPSDPRSFAAQASLHCAFCNGAYSQRLNTTSTHPPGGIPPSVQVHFSWLFLPWHRWFLFFHERILASLVGDPSFALVYWNWDNQRFGGNVIPPMFLRADCGALVDSNRNPAHDHVQGGRNTSATSQYLVRLSPADNSSDATVVEQQNLNSMYQSVVTARTADLFAGGPFRLGMDIENSTVLRAPLAGSLESGPHNGVHFWSGDPSALLHQDMGTFSTAARDPLFYAHHSNVDRLWHLWRHAMPDGPRPDHDDPDFLESTFVFYDHRSRLVKVKVSDALDIGRLGYDYGGDGEYDDGASLWINYEPLPISGSGTVAVAEARKMGAVEMGEDAGFDVPLSGHSLCAIVLNPSSARVLEILGLRTGADPSNRTVSAGSLLQLAVFVNLPSATSSTPTHSAEFVGSYTLLPRQRPRGAGRFLTNVRLEIGDNLRRIGIQEQPRVVIAVVVKRRVPTSLVASIRGLRLV